MNISAQKLYPHELVYMKESEEIRHKIFKSYKLMLDFYGMQLLNEESGEIGRTDNYQQCVRKTFQFSFLFFFFTI